MIQNVRYSNGTSSHVTLTFEYLTPREGVINDPVQNVPFNITMTEILTTVAVNNGHSLLKRIYVTTH